MRSTAMRLVIAGFVVATACNEDRKNGDRGDASTGGSGGISNDGGSESGGSESGGSESGGFESGGAGGSRGGTGGIGGTTGGTGATLATPKCLRDLFAQCPLTGACVQTDPQASRVRSCYDEGTVQLFISGTACSNGEARVYRSDGSLCYSAINLAYAEHACENGTTQWYDAEGKLVASASENTSGLPPLTRQIACAVGGETSRCTLQGGPGPQCVSDAPFPGVPKCSLGSCGDAGVVPPPVDAGSPDANRD